MNVLSFLNVSNKDNLGCDSGVIFQRQLGEALIEQGHKFTLVLPGSIENSVIDFKYHDFGSNKFQVRYAFNWEKVKSLIQDGNFDVILSNQPELSANIKAVLVAEHIPIKLFTYVHYFPHEIGEENALIYDSSLNNGDLCSSITLSFLAGLMASDQLLVHSSYAARMLDFIASKHNVTSDLPPVSLLPPPYDEAFLRLRSTTPQTQNILYNHRLYKQYGTEFLLEFAREIQQKRNWTITITDLLYNRNQNRANLDHTVDGYRDQLACLPHVQFRNDGNNRSEYIKIIQSSKIALAPFRKNCSWSMSIIDCMAAGVPVVGPNFAWFQEFLPPELLFNSKEELVAITNRLFTDNLFYQKTSEKVYYQIVERNLSSAAVAQRFLACISESACTNAAS